MAGCPGRNSKINFFTIFKHNSNDHQFLGIGKSENVLTQIHVEKF